MVLGGFPIFVTQLLLRQEATVWIDNDLDSRQAMYIAFRPRNNVSPEKMPSYKQK